MRSIKTKLKTNNKEKTQCAKHAGLARHACNWGLKLLTENIYKGEKILSSVDLHRKLNAEVKKECAWYYESSKCAPQQALRDLTKSMGVFWKKKHKENLKKKFADRYLKKYLIKYKKGELKALTFEHEKGYPKLHKKGVQDSFYLEGSITVESYRIKIPRIGWVKTHEELPIINVKNVTVSLIAGEWYISFKVDVDPKVEHKITGKTCGVDLGIKTLATLSDGTFVESPKAYKRNKVKLQKLQRKLSKQYEIGSTVDKNDKKTVSKNYKKTKLKLARQHRKVANVRLDATHKLTTNLVKNHDRITIEDLNVSGMMKNHNLAAAIQDGGFFEFKRQLAYKCKWSGVELIIADRWFASSKTCSCCGHKQEMPLRTRIFKCERCENESDRDLNAAINLDNYGNNMRQALT